MEKCFSLQLLHWVKIMVKLTVLLCIFYRMLLAKEWKGQEIASFLEYPSNTWNPKTWSSFFTCYGEILLWKHFLWLYFLSSFVRKHQWQLFGLNHIREHVWVFQFICSGESNYLPIKDVRLLYQTIFFVYITLNFQASAFSVLLHAAVYGSAVVPDSYRDVKCCTFHFVNFTGFWEKKILFYVCGSVKD